MDYLYLNDLTMLDSIQDSSEILEIIKLSKLYKLDGLFKAAETYFQEIIFLWFENHSVFTLKPNVISYLNGSGNSSSSSKRGQASILAKNKNEGAEAVPSSVGGQPSSNPQALNMG